MATAVVSATGGESAPVGVEVTARQIEAIIEIVAAASPEPVTDVGNVGIGSKLIGSIPVSPLPYRVVRIVPAFANHAYILLDNGRVAIIEPIGLTVVAIF